MLLATQHEGLNDLNMLWECLLLSHNAESFIQKKRFEGKLETLGEIADYFLVTSSEGHQNLNDIPEQQCYRSEQSE